MKHSPRFLALVEDVKTRIRETDVKEVMTRLGRENRKFILLDVREENEWVRGHLPGAMHLSKGLLERDIEKKIPDLKAEIILYCGGGYRSALAADNLQKMGYQNVISMDGGYTAWVEAGFPISSG